jgi:hypothetical protein
LGYLRTASPNRFTGSLGPKTTFPALDVAATTDRIYVGVSRSNFGGGLEIFSRAEDGVGVHLGSYAIPPGPEGSSEATGVAAFENYVFLACTSSGLQIVDARDPSKTVPVGNYTFTGRDGRPGRVRKILLNGELAFLATDADGIHILDVSDPARPSLVAIHNSRPTDAPLNSVSSYVRNLAVVGDHLYAATSSYGLEILDISKLAVLELSISPTPEAPAIDLAGYPGRRYTIEISEDLSSPENWTSLVTVMLTNRTATLPGLVTDSEKQRFYRARLAPTDGSD